MSPSVIVLNACAALFLVLFFIFSSQLVLRLRKSRKEQLAPLEEAKQVPLYQSESKQEAQNQTMARRKAKFQFADAE